MVGCQTTNNISKKTNALFFADGFYIKKDNIFTEYIELDSLEERISKWEYRKLPNYLQECYKKRRKKEKKYVWYDTSR